MNAICWLTDDNLFYNNSIVNLLGEFWNTLQNFNKTSFSFEEGGYLL